MSESAARSSEALEAAAERVEALLASARRRIWLGFTIAFFTTPFSV